MDKDFASIFAVICDAISKEAQRTAGFPLATPFHMLTSVRGLPVRGEAHLVYAMASALDARGYQPFIEEPYAITHSKGKIRRCDFRIALDRPDDPIFTQFLTFEVKHYLLLDKSFRGMLDDIAKIKSVLEDEHGILNLPVAFLLVGFTHEGRDDWTKKRLQSFVQRADIGDWSCFSRDLEIAAEGQPMRFCLLDMWVLSEL